MTVDTINGKSLEDIISSATGTLVVGEPGDWQLVHPATAAIAIHPAAAWASLDAPVAATPLAGLDAAQQVVVKAAVAKSVAAAAATPSAVTDGAPVNVAAPAVATVSATVGTSVGGIFSGLEAVGQIVGDIVAIHNGGAGKIHWWGWEATLNEPATQALLHLLSYDVPTVGTVLAAAFAAEVPVFAAISGILGIVSGLLGTEVKNADTATPTKGVSMKGYLWVGLSVKSN
jgi:hypothetical protein